MNKIEIGVCILFFEKVDQTLECVESLEKGLDLDMKKQVNIYLLNNGSSKESLEKLRENVKKYDNVHIFDAGRNLGVSGGRNYLINHTKEEWLWFLDNDIVVKTADYFTRIYKHIESDPDIEVFIPVLYNKHVLEYSHSTPYYVDGKIVKRKHKRIWQKKINWTNNFPGGASFVNRIVFEKNGLYDEVMFVGVEDFEFALRALMNKQPINALHVDDIRIVHDHRLTVNVEDKKAIEVRYDESRHKVSYDRIKEKLGIELNEDYASWLNQQKDQMLKGRGVASILMEKVVKRGRSELKAFIKRARK